MSTMMSGRGPPPRHPSVAANNDVGSLCPPPPQQTSSPYHHVRNQNQQPQMQYQNSSYQMQQSYSYNNGHYQQSQLNVGGAQYAYQNQQHHPITQHQYSYAGYSASIPSQPPPPPPPPPPKHPMSSTNITTHNGTISSNNDRQNQQQSSSTQHDKVEKQKKVNPKMAQKYSGQGLKTITISGPGIRPQKFKICVGNHPDDIKKWIEERRKRFPRSTTTKNISGSGECTNNDIMTKRSREDDTQDEGRKEQKKQCKEAAGEKVASLSNLLAGYGSSSSLSDNESAVAKVEQVGEDVNIETTLKSAPAEGGASEQSQPMRICKYYQRDKCRHGESCKFLHSEKSSSLAKSDDQRQKKRHSQSARDKARNDYERELQVLGLANPSHVSRHNNSGGKTITNSSLLLKLLQRDKERERRLSLQLLRYIVDCDYFQSQTKEPKDEQV
jgi:hypothetical protein